MTDFKTYYNTKFRDDINRFFSTIPDESKFHEDNQNKQIFSITFNPSIWTSKLLRQGRKRIIWGSAFLYCFDRYGLFFKIQATLLQIPKLYSIPKIHWKLSGWLPISPRTERHILCYE